MGQGQRIIVSAAAVLFGLAAGQSVRATTFETGMGDVGGTWSTNLTGAIGLRTKSPSCSLTGDPNYCGSAANTAQWASGDDGDLNYAKGHLYTANAQLTSELILSAPIEGWKALTRFTSIYDFAATQTERTDLSPGARQQIVRNFLPLDWWLEKDFTLADKRMHIRAGNQVINWGESVYAFGGINATNSLDVQKLYTPGTQLKQVLLPAPMISFQSDLPAHFSTEAYVQPHWNANRYPPVGTYWSYTDVFGRGALPGTFSTQNFNAGGVDGAYIAGPYLSQNRNLLGQIYSNLMAGTYAGAPYYSLGVPYNTYEPDNHLEYGLRTNYKASFASFSAYYVNYTDKSPVLTYLNTESAAEWTYRSGRRLFGVSTNLPLGMWALGGELSYRPKDAVSMSGCYGAGGPTDANTNLAAGNCAAYRDFKKWQLDVNGQLQLSQTTDPIITRGLLHATTSYLTVELTWIKYPGLNEHAQYGSTVNGSKVYQVPDAGYAVWLQPSAALGYNIAEAQGTQDSMGATIDYNFTYDGTIIPGWGVTAGTTFFDAFKGNTPTFSANYESGYKSVNVYLLFNQNPSKWQAGMNFTAFFGGNPLSQPFADRNNVGMFVTRNF